MATVNEAEIPSLKFDQQASDIATPASGFDVLYTKSGGLYLRNAAGTVVGPFAAAAGSATGTVIARAKARHNTTQNVSTGSATAMLFNTETFDTASIHDTSSNTSRFVAPSGTVYAEVEACITVPVAAGSTRNQMQGYLRVNGSTIIEPYVRSPQEISTLFTVTMRIGGMVELSPGDYLEVVILQATGGTLAFGSATGSANNKFEVKFYN